jgi:hypothetical protein
LNIKGFDSAPLQVLADTAKRGSETNIAGSCRLAGTPINSHKTIHRFVMVNGKNSRLKNQQKRSLMAAPKYGCADDLSRDCFS